MTRAFADPELDAHTAQVALIHVYATAIGLPALFALRAAKIFAVGVEATAGAFQNPAPHGLPLWAGIMLPQIRANRHRSPTLRRTSFSRSFRSHTVYACASS